jgi:transposase InsO family protein
MLVELSVVEQRYHAVLEVLVSRVPVSEVADRYGVSRKSVHAWVRRYAESGLAGLADRSHRPHHQPRQVSAAVEAAICQLRTAHPRWGPRRIRFELGRHGCPGPVPSRSTVYRVLVRNHFVTARPRKRRREDYKRWERPAPMQLWQLDVMGSVRLADGREIKLISGVDDHSRFCVIATVVVRATARAVCAAFARALVEFGVPEQVLTDNGKQFTGKYGRPRPAEVLFDRICRKNGNEHLLTRPRTPTTTGKIERWHQSIQTEFLDEQPAFASVDEAQAAVDAWRAEYNTTRPHQSLDMASPADRFRPAPPADLPLWLPADLAPAAPPPSTTEPADRAASTPPAPAAAPATGSVPADAVEVDRVVPASGNLQVAGQQFWLGPHRAGQPVTLWIDTTTAHLTIAGQHLKTVPSRLSTVDLARLRHDGGRPAGPPPARPSPGLLATGATVELDRLVHAQGVVVLAGRQLPVGQPLAGRRVTLRLEAQLVHVIADGQLWRTIAFTLPPDQRARLRGRPHRRPTTRPRRQPHPGPAAGVQPRRDPGHRPTRPGGLPPRRRHRHHRSRRHRPAGLRPARQHHHRRPPHQPEGGHPPQGLRTHRPGLESVTPQMKPNRPPSDGTRHMSDSA